MKNLKPATAAPPHPHGLSLSQQSAVDLLAAGKNDTETAAALNLHRVTVTRWRLYSPAFRAALADQRAAIWGAAADRLRALLPVALDTLAAEMGPHRARRVAVALGLLKLAGPIPATPTDPTEPEEYVRGTVHRERRRVREQADVLFTGYGLPAIADHEEVVRKRLAEQAGGDGR